jgi:hypothetical protein
LCYRRRRRKRRRKWRKRRRRRRKKERKKKTEKKNKKTEKKRRRRRGGKKNNNLFSFELGFQINNLVELGFLKIFYLICLTRKKKKLGWWHNYMMWKIQV